MFQRMLVLATLGVVASTLTVQAANPPASPLTAANLRGHWVCSRTGGPAGSFSEDWTPVFGGTWLRATDSVKGQVTAEHNLTYSKADSTWIVTDVLPLGSYDVLHGTGSGMTKIVFHAVYPKITLQVNYVRLTPSKYSVDVTGNVNGRNIKTHSVCNKR